MKKLIATLWFMFLFTSITLIFWHSEWKYNLPTPIPINYHPVNKGEIVSLKLINTADDTLPLFVHFFNPDCPCSKFNMPHFQALVRKYHAQINFVMVVISANKKFTESEIQDKYNLHIPVYFNTAIANQCGVYSTPQAVLLGADKKLYYRGNYNKSRYCTSAISNYAQMAIDSLLNNNSYPNFNQYALNAYGCQLPGCKK